MERKVLEYIRSNNMLSEGDGVVIGVSGGADSMCLLDILISLKERLGLRLLAVHINHGIRGASADADEHFVGAFCVEKGIDFHAVHADVPAIAQERGLTEEEAGRLVRYESFEAACRKYGYEKIAVAHNSDDNAETVLFNIARGSGISGLRGIAPVRELSGLTVIRPVLCCSRSEIEQYLHEKGITYRTDETNLTDEYSRNRMRNKILPMLREGINAGVSAHIANLAEQAADLEEFVGEAASETYEKLKSAGQLEAEYDENGVIKKICVEAEPLIGMKRALKTAVLRMITGQMAGKLKDIGFMHIKAAEDLLEASVGKRADIPYGITVRRDYEQLIFEKRAQENEKKEFCETVAEPDDFPAEYHLQNGKILTLNLTPCEKMLNIPRNDYTKYFDYDKIIGKIELRTRREGDYMLIKGSKADPDNLHRKSLKSLFIDMKLPAGIRDGVVLLAEGSHVLWAIGYRRDDSCFVTGDTRRILVAELGIQS